MNQTSTNSCAVSMIVGQAIERLDEEERRLIKH